MEAMQTALKRGRDVWDSINMPRIEFQKRVETIRKEMRKKNIDVLLLYGNGVNEYGNSCYVTNFVVAQARGALAIIPLEGEIGLIFEGASRGLPAAKNTTWVEDVRPCWDVSREAVKYLEEKNLLRSTVGLASLKKLMPYHQLQFLFQSLKDCKIMDSDDIIRDMRILKSERECDQIRRASRIVNSAFNLIPGYFSPNVSGRILEADIDRAVRLEGAEDTRILLAKPREDNWTLRPAEDGKITPEDAIIVYIAVEFERYWSEGVRTFVAKPDSLVTPQIDSTRTLYERIISGIRPGRSASEFYRGAVDELNKNSVHWIPDYGLGQGIGLGLQEPPVLSERDTTPFKEGMCLAVRLAIRDDDKGAVMIGDTVYLSANGPEVLA
ncbi:M24 family metallopeptidase [Chloroflexota bacterium]